MKAVCFAGANRLAVNEVADPELVNAHDAIVRVHLSTTCGSDLHLLGGFVPTMRKGDVFGHEFMGEIVETGNAVERLRAGDRVTVSPLLGCGRCFYCKRGEFSLCDNTNPQPELAEKVLGHAIAGVLGYSHALGGFAGCHTAYVRVPYADVNAIEVPDGVTDEQALFASDAFPTGYMGADLCNIQPGDVVAVWGAGGVGLMAMLSAKLLGAERVIAIDRIPERLALAEKHTGAETLDYTQVDVTDALTALTGGRGPDACIDAVGMEAHDIGLEYAYDRVKQALRLESDRGTVLRQMIHACRKGGVVSIMGVYGGLVDKFPIGIAMNKALTLRMGQQHGPRYIPRLLEHIGRGEADPSFLVTHRLSVEDGPRGYELFEKKLDGCVRVVFSPAGAAGAEKPS